MADNAVGSKQLTFTLKKVRHLFDAPPQVETLEERDRSITAMIIVTSIKASSSLAHKQ